VGLGSRASGRDDFSDDMAPPYSLMEHPPLAVFVNGKIQFPSVKDFKDAKTMEDVCPVHLWCSAGNEQQWAHSIWDMLLFNDILFTLIWHLASEILIHYCDVRSSSSSK
jgi:hypothetical protein